MSVFAQNGEVKVVAICRPCLQLFLTKEVGLFFNPNTRTIVQNQLNAISLPLRPLPTEPSTQDHTGQAWPILPLGALLWAYLSDKKA
jgi:hypothetical protein